MPYKVFLLTSYNTDLTAKSCNLFISFMVLYYSVVYCVKRWPLQTKTLNKCYFVKTWWCSACNKKLVALICAPCQSGGLSFYCWEIVEELNLIFQNGADWKADKISNRMIQKLFVCGEDVILFETLVTRSMIWHNCFDLLFYSLIRMLRFFLKTCTDNVNNTCSKCMKGYGISLVLKLVSFNLTCFSYSCECSR